MRFSNIVILREAKPTEGSLSRGGSLVGLRKSLGARAIPRSPSLRSGSLRMTLIVLAACSKTAPQQAPTVPVRVAMATQIAAPLTLSANGVVEPMQTVAV